MKMVKQPNAMSGLGPSIGSPGQGVSAKLLASLSASRIKRTPSETAKGKSSPHETQKLKSKHGSNQPVDEADGKNSTTQTDKLKAKR